MAVITQNLGKHIVYEDCGEGDGITLWTTGAYSTGLPLHLTEKDAEELAWLLLARETDEQRRARLSRTLRANKGKKASA